MSEEYIVDPISSLNSGTILSGILHEEILEESTLSDFNGMIIRGTEYTFLKTSAWSASHKSTLDTIVTNHPVITLPPEGDDVSYQTAAVIEDPGSGNHSRRNVNIPMDILQYIFSFIGIDHYTQIPMVNVRMSQNIKICQGQHPILGDTRWCMCDTNLWSSLHFDIAYKVVYNSRINNFPFYFPLNFLKNTKLATYVHQFKI